MVELGTRKRETRGDGANQHEKLGLKRISCASQCSIPDTGGRSPNPACNNTNTRSSQPNQGSGNAVLSYPLRSSTLFSPAFPSLSFSSTTLPSSHNTKLSRPSPPLYVMIMSWYGVQHTLSTAYTEYIIHPRLSAFPEFSWLHVDPWM